jgi:hypothetical protein
MQRLQNFKNGSCKFVRDVCGIRPQVEARQAIWTRRIGRKRFCDVEKLAFGKTNHRTAQQCAEGERVPAVS